jgi:hypothetical protein
MVWFMCLALVAFSLPVRVPATTDWPVGRQTAAGAAAPVLSGGNSKHAGRLIAAFAYADTTEYEFPEEEDEKRNVVKDVILWTAVMGFVAYFVIEVFIKGDTETPPPPPNQKPPPPPPGVSGFVGHSPW